MKKKTTISNLCFLSFLLSSSSVQLNGLYTYSIVYAQPFEVAGEKKSAIYTVSDNILSFKDNNKYLDTYLVEIGSLNDNNLIFKYGGKDWVGEACTLLNITEENGNRFICHFKGLDSGFSHYIYFNLGSGDDYDIKYKMSESVEFRSYERPCSFPTETKPIYKVSTDEGGLKTGIIMLNDPGDGGIVTITLKEGDNTVSGGTPYFKIEKESQISRYNFEDGSSLIYKDLNGNFCSLSCHYQQSDDFAHLVHYAPGSYIPIRPNRVEIINGEAGCYTLIFKDVTYSNSFAISNFISYKEGTKEAYNFRILVNDSPRYYGIFPSILQSFYDPILNALVLKLKDDIDGGTVTLTFYIRDSYDAKHLPLKIEKSPIDETKGPKGDKGDKGPKGDKGDFVPQAYFIAAYDGNSNQIGKGLPTSSQAKLLESSSVKNKYAIVFPNGYLKSLNKDWESLTTAQIFGVLLAEDANKNVIKQVEVNPTQYGDDNFCWFEFTVPGETKTFQFHIYKDILLSENFILKYLIK